MILAAGLGKRMGPISRYLAKPAVPFLGVPMIERAVATLRSAGVREITINTHHLPETVSDILGDGSRLGVEISYSHENPILGTGGGIGRVREFFDDETFMVINSDVIIDIDAAEVVAAHRLSGAAATLVLRPDTEGRYSSVLLDHENRIRQIEGLPKTDGELPSGCRSNLMFAGLHVIEPRWFDYTPRKEEYDSIRDVYAPMIAAGEKIGGFLFEGEWIDIGSARRLLDATLAALPEEGIVPHPAAVEGSRVRRSLLSPGAIVGRNCHLEDVVFIGGAEIGDGSRLRRCIVCPGARLPAGFRAREAVIAESAATPLDALE